MGNNINFIAKYRKKWDNIKITNVKHNMSNKVD